MGFLDPAERIQDVVLTAEGRRLYAAGELSFDYFVLFDDEVDYDPYLTGTGSLSSQEIEEIVISTIEDTPILEAPTGKLVDNCSDPDFTFSPRSPLFDMPQGQAILPRFNMVPDTTGSRMEVRQVHVGAEGKQAIVRQSDTRLHLSFSVSDGGPVSLGTRISVFQSGSDGLRRIEPVLDYVGRQSFGTHIAVIEDGLEQTIKTIEKDVKR